MKSPYINHITLSTGHTRRSPRNEVGDEPLRLLVPWLNDMLVGQIPLPLPVPNLYHYSASATVDGGGLVCTIWGPAGPHTPGLPYAGEAIPIITLGVAQRSRHGEDLWARMVANFGAAASAKCPSEPWCAVALHPGMAMYPDSSEWLGDLERCIAWAWITRAPHLRAA